MLSVLLCKLAFMVDPDAMGKRIYARRNELGLNRLAVAAYCGVTQQAVGNWERGDVFNLKLEHLLRLLERLDRPFSWLVDGVVPDEPATKPAPPLDFEVLLAASEKIAEACKDRGIKIEKATHQQYLDAIYFTYKRLAERKKLSVADADKMIAKLTTPLVVNKRQR